MASGTVVKSGICRDNNQSRVTAPAGPYMRVSWFFRHDDVPGLLAAASRPGDANRHVKGSCYSTVTLLARLRGLSMSRPSLAATW